MRKQKVDGATEDDMNTVVAIHNNMNENTWRQVLAWESLHPAASPDKAPKLLRFLGRPDELSPKARYIPSYTCMLLSLLLLFIHHESLFFLQIEGSVRSCGPVRPTRLGGGSRRDGSAIYHRLLPR